jgi:hypothetical protein
MASFPRLAGMAVDLSRWTVASLPFLFVFAMQPFFFGIWYQSAPVVVALSGLGAAAAAVLAVLAMVRVPVGAIILRSPPVLVLLALAAWGAISAAASDVPGRGLLGAVDNGEGPLLFLSLAVLATLAAIMPWDLRCRRMVGIGVMMAVVAMVAVQTWDDPHWRPVAYPDYLAFVGLFAAIILLMQRPVAAKYWTAGVLVALAATLYFSENRSALLLTGVILPVGWLLLRESIRRGWAQMRWFPPSVFLALALGVAAMTVAIVKTADSDVFQPLGAVATGSMQSRGYLSRTALTALGAEPHLLVLGEGWGGVNDVLFRHLLIDPVRLFKDGIRAPNWEALGGGAFHVHNQFLEAAVCAGLPAALLWLAVPALAVVAAARRGQPLVGALWAVFCALLGLWFLMPPTWPLLALALAATMGSSAQVLETTAGGAAGNWRSVTALALIGGVLAGGALLEIRAAGAGSALLDRVTGPLPPQSLRRSNSLLAAGWTDTATDSELWWVTLNHLIHLTRTVDAGHGLTTDQAAWFETLLSAVENRVNSGRAGTRLTSLAVVMRNDLLTVHRFHGFQALAQKYGPSWHGALTTFLAVAPKRSDLAVPVLAMALQEQRDEDLRVVGDSILAGKPDDAVGLWFSGMGRLADARTEADGLRRVSLALRHGIDRVYPVDPKLREMVEKAVR